MFFIGLQRNDTFCVLPIFYRKIGSKKIVLPNLMTSAWGKIILILNPIIQDRDYTAWFHTLGLFLIFSKASFSYKKYLRNA